MVCCALCCAVHRPEKQRGGPVTPTEMAGWTGERSAWFSDAALRWAGEGWQCRTALREGSWRSS